MSETQFVSAADAKKHSKLVLQPIEGMGACTKKMNKIRLLLVPGGDVYHVNELVERFNKGRQGTDERER